jgi:hypothetical protein
MHRFKYDKKKQFIFLGREVMNHSEGLIKQ